MVHHVVMWKLKDAPEGSGPGWAADAGRKIREGIEGLRGVVPGILHLEVGVNNAGPEGNWDVVLLTRFADCAGLEAYQVHPAHQAVAAMVRSLVQARSCVDWQTP